MAMSAARRLLAALSLPWGGPVALASPLPETLIALDGPEGRALLETATARAGYGPLARNFAPQRKPTWCGPATIALVLNALHDDASGARAPAPPFDQERVFTPAVQAVRSRRQVDRRGMTLPVFAAALAAHDVAVELRHAVDATLGEFRLMAAATLGGARRFVAVNYLRSALGQEGAGHISPLAAYHGPSDRFLVLDVGGAGRPPVWVDATRLFDAMNTPGGGRSRGYVLAWR
jgi:hypothetical protein